MNYKRAYSLLKKIGFTRVGGTKEELEAANILLDEINSASGVGVLESFELQSSNDETATLEVCSPIVKSFNVSPYSCCACTPNEGIRAPFYYMELGDEVDKVKAKGKIVLVNGYLNRKTYKNICDAKALGFITFSGDVVRDNAVNSDLDIRELRAALHEDFGKLPGVHMRTYDALALVKSNPVEVLLKVEQQITTCTSHNVVASIDGNGEYDDIIVFTAHYDSVIHSKGVYDNGAGSVILMELYRHFLINPPKRTLKFIWCGSEERGLQGSKAYVRDHQEEMEKIRLCINVDVGAPVLGRERIVCTSDVSLCNFISYLAKIEGYSIDVQNDIYSSDSIPFAGIGIPGVNFARDGVPGSAHIHNRHDTLAFLSTKSLEKTGDFALRFADLVANSVAFPIVKSLPEYITKKVDIYLNKKDK